MKPNFPLIIGDIYTPINPQLSNHEYEDVLPSEMKLDYVDFTEAKVKLTSVKSFLCAEMTIDTFQYFFKPLEEKL